MAISSLVQSSSGGVLMGPQNPHMNHIASKQKLNQASPPGLAHSSGRGLVVGKVWIPGGGTKGYVPEEHPLSPPHPCARATVPAQIVRVECFAPNYILIWNVGPAS